MKYLSLILIMILLISSIDIHSQEVHLNDNRFKIKNVDNFAKKTDGSETYEKRIVFKDTVFTFSGFTSTSLSADGFLVGLREFKYDGESVLKVYDTLGVLQKSHIIPPNTAQGTWLFNCGYYALFGNKHSGDHTEDTFRFYLYDYEGALQFKNSAPWSYCTEINIDLSGNIGIVKAPLLNSQQVQYQIVLLQDLDSQPIILSKIFDGYPNPHVNCQALIDSKNKRISVYFNKGPHHDQNLDSLFFKYNSKCIEEL